MLQLTSRVRIVDQLTFANDGKRLYAAGTWVLAVEKNLRRENRGIDVWDLPGQSESTSQWLPKKSIEGFIVNPASQWLYANAHEYSRNSGYLDSGLFALDTDTGDSTRLELGISFVRRPAIHPSGTWFIGYGSRQDWSNPRVVGWSQPSDGPPELVWDRNPQASEGRPWSMVYDHAHSRVITIEGEVQRDRGFVGHLVFRDPSIWTVQKRFDIVEEGYDQLVISPDGAWLVNIARSSFVTRSSPSIILRATSDLNREPMSISDGKKHFTGIAFHPSGRYLAATSNDSTVKLYDTESWGLARTFTWDIGRMRSIAFSPDGLLAAAGSDSGKVVVWDVDL